MLSVVITAWNEELNLERAVSSIKGIADEVIVVDTESTDETVKIAKQLGCKVFHHKNTGIVEPVRNFSISKAKGDWILLLDADEEVPPSLAEEIKSQIAMSNGPDYFRIPRKSLIFGKWIKSSHWWPDYVYRLFKKGSVTWGDAIHSIPLTKGKGADLPAQEKFGLVHHHYTSISQYVERLNRYTDHQLKLKLAAGYNFSWTDLLTKPSEEFLSQYFSRHAYKEGLHGLALSLLQAFSELVLYLKLWQSSAFVTKPLDPAEVKTVLAQSARDFNWWLIQSKISESGFLGKLLLKTVRKLGL